MNASNQYLGDAPQTLFDKLWNQHVIEDFGDGWSLIHIDRIVLHDMSGARSLQELQKRALKTENPDLCFATPDHTVSTAPNRINIEAPLCNAMRKGAAEHGIRLFDLGELGQGIVHVAGPELGFVLPGTSVICGDSHTCTNGALGAMAFGVGSTELAQALATQVLLQRKPRNMRIRLEGALKKGVSSKDVILYLIGKFGASAGTGFAVEYSGSAVEAMSVEARMTLCNLSIEMGAKFGVVAPDEKVAQYLKSRQFSPKGNQFESACKHWSLLTSDELAKFDRDELVDVGAIAPQCTWGTSPEHVCAIDDEVPDWKSAAAKGHSEAARLALEYMNLAPGEKLIGQRIDRVFIGSCTNSRIEDLQAAAALLKPGAKVASHVEAWVVPGSEAVKREAESLGLADMFRAAGFKWREPGCSMCVAANGETAGPGQRVVSTTNRNFVGRQGPGARTHLASPATAVASALAGEIADPRFINEEMGLAHHETI